jgi:hypothetical protein
VTAGRLLRAAVVTAVLVVLVRPELSRYRAERTLRAAIDALRVILTHPNEVADPPGALERTAQAAASAIAPLPGDPRPRLVEGSARYVRGDWQRALEIYLGALALGERGEIDLNVARSLERLGREEDARAAFVRAVWVSPALLASILPDVQAPVAAEVTRLEAELSKGNLAKPPPMPAR